MRIRAAEHLRFGGQFSLDDRRRGSDRMVLVLAGFKSYLWPYTLPRIARFAPADADVCVVSAGVTSPELAEVARANGWSYLTTRTRRLASAQNIAIREHSHAQWIFKVDEDVFATEGSFDRVLDGHQAVDAEGVYRPGFAAPILNVNGFSYVPFLEALGLLNRFAEEFGGLPRACTEIPVQRDGRAAAWIWDHSVPLDDVARTFTDREFSYSTIPHRFSTGFILFHRDFWEEISGIRATLAAPG